MSVLECSKKWIDLPQGTILWRAQLDGSPYTPPPVDGVEFRSLLVAHDRERMLPWPDKAREGRINPKGISCFYSATNPHIALSELKPQVGAYLTLAEFVTTQNLRIVDFAVDRIELADPNGLPTDEEMEAMVWEDINDLFARPVNNTDDIADYAPTQILSEVFRRRGYDDGRAAVFRRFWKAAWPSGGSERVGGILFRSAAAVSYT
jgi:RES domain